MDLSGWDLSSIGQKRGMGIIISLKTGPGPWLPKDKIGTYIAGKDIITPDDVRATQIHEDPDDLSQPTPSRGVRGDKRTSQRSLGPQFTTEWKNSVDSRLTSLAQLFDENSVVRAVRVACRSTKEGCVVV